jgi:hypothetical protein
MDLERLLADGARALSRAWSRPVLLTQPQVLKMESRSHVVRARVRGGDVPSVILKHFRDEPVCGLDDWAGAEFLTLRGLRVSPRFLAGDFDSRLFLLEDLGTAPSLEDVLRGTDARAATASLLAVARLTGQLHARTRGFQAEYDLVRHTVQPRHERVRIENARYLLDHGARLRRWLSTVGAEEAPGTQGDLETLARALASPGPFLAFTHGDMAPSNTLFTAEGPFLLDFEYAGMRHALHDALMWLLVVPLPEDVISRADSAYRAALMQGCEEARSDAAYTRARATLAAARTVNLLQWIAPKALEVEREWAPGLSERAALLRHLERCRLLLRSAEDLVPALARTLAGLEVCLRQRWPVTDFVWPAFR